MFQGRLEELFLHESDFCVRIPLTISFKYLSALVLEISIPGGDEQLTFAQLLMRGWSNLMLLADCMPAVA